MKQQFIDRLLTWLLRGAMYLIVLVIGYMVLRVIWLGAPAINWTFLTASPSARGNSGGIFPAILGTLYLVLGTMAVALPLGMASAIYLSEYARQNRLTQFIRTGITTLAGIPSIVFGLFGLGLFVITLGFRASILSGSLTLACMVLPTIIVSSEEALRAVPRALREGSLALGATKWQTISRNVLPYAIPGMLTGAILGIGRAAGETAPIMLTAAVFFQSRLPRSIFDGVMALPYHLYELAIFNRAPQMQYGTAFVLLVLVLGISIGAILLRSHFRKRYQW